MTIANTALDALILSNSNLNVSISYSTPPAYKSLTSFAASFVGARMILVIATIILSLRADKPADANKLSFKVVMDAGTAKPWTP